MIFFFKLILQHSKKINQLLEKGSKRLLYFYYLFYYLILIKLK